MFPKIGVPQNGLFLMENPFLNRGFRGTIIFWKYPYISLQHHPATYKKMAGPKSFNLLFMFEFVEAACQQV